MNRAEREALKELRSNTDIIIKQVDKGGAIVIMPKEYYKNMVMTHLHDTLTCEKIADITTTPNVMDVLHKFVSNYDNILTKMESRCITEFKASPRKFYCLPKVHKSE